MDQRFSSTSIDLPTVWADLRPRNALGLVAGIRTLIRSGLIRPGDPLPPERELAPALGLARNTVRSAMRTLEREGLISTNSTRGRAVLAADGNGRMSHTLALISDKPVSLAKAQGHRGWVHYLFVAAMARIHEHGYQALSCVAPDSEPSAMQRIIEDRPGGLLLPIDMGETPAQNPRVKAACRSGLPCTIYGDISADFETCDAVCTDDRAAGRLLAEWFVRRGCRRILQVNRWRDLPHWLRQREAGFEEVLREAGVDVLPVLRTSPFPIRDVEQAEDFDVARRLWLSHLMPYTQGEQRVDAVACLVDKESFAVSAALKDLGRVPGRDILVSGYDNSWTTDTARQFEPTPPTVTVEKHFDEIGGKMVDLLLARISGELPAEPQRVIVKPTIVETEPGETVAAGM
jgi:DNA-binding LacI/PurR family transcriptional regulator